MVLFDGLVSTSLWKAKLKKLIVPVVLVRIAPEISRQNSILNYTALWESGCQLSSQMEAWEGAWYILILCTGFL